MKGRWAMTLVLVAAGCAEVGRGAAPILNGSPSSEGSVAVLYGTDSGCIRPGVFLDARRFLAPAGCEGPRFQVVSGPVREPREILRVVDAYESFMGLPNPAGEGQIRLAVYVTAEPSSAPPARLPDAAPSVDDEVRMVGWGAGTGSSEEITEGAFEVVEVAPVSFRLEPVGAVRGCDLDGPVFDDAGAIVGFAVLGVMDADTPGCFFGSTALSVAPMRAFVDDALSRPLPEETDAAVEVDSAIPPADAGSGESGGGGCAVGGRRAALPLCLAFPIGAALARRRAR